MKYVKSLSFLVGVATIGFLGMGIANAQSARECEFYAQDYARRFSANGQVAGGAARGALLGAGVGAFSGRAGRGAAIGAGVGAVAGARRASSASRIRDHAFRECMAGRARWTWIDDLSRDSMDLVRASGGSNGAFRGDVLDGLLEESWLDLSSKSSAGAMNTSVPADG
jgi:YMGG-like Gly-zipper